MPPLSRRSFSAATLFRDYQPRSLHQSKRVVWDVSCSGSPPEGTIDVARWPARSLPDRVPDPGDILIEASPFTYPPDPDALTVRWHVNFADPELFGYYDGPLFAQDEMQVAEHPALGSIRDALAADGNAVRTLDELRAPTPVTVTGVERRCVIHTGRAPELGRPFGLYGNAFAAASLAVVCAATERIDPPTLTNILAMAAPGYGSGVYQAGAIDHILVTAYSAFTAARDETHRMKGATARTIVHTGFWGCGAFGGNRDLMTILQALAADLACIRLVFHAMNDAGVRTAAAAHHLYRHLRAAGDGTDRLVAAIVEQGFEWGVTNRT